MNEIDRHILVQYEDTHLYMNSPDFWPFLIDLIEFKNYILRKKHCNRAKKKNDRCIVHMLHYEVIFAANVLKFLFHNYLVMATGTR